MWRKSLALATLTTLVGCSSPYVDPFPELASCPPSQECVANDVSPTCKELIPQMNTCIDDCINLVSVGVNYEPDAFYSIAREGVGHTLEEPFFAAHADRINWHYVPHTAFVESDKWHGGAPATQPGEALAKECDVENAFPIIYVNEGFTSNVNVRDTDLLTHITSYDITDVQAARETENCEGELDEVAQLACNEGYLTTSVRISAGARAREVPHELFHLFGFIDERHILFQNEPGIDIAKILSEDPRNCFIGTFDECMAHAPWADLHGEEYRYQIVGCYPGCGGAYENAWRSVHSGLLRFHQSPFGIGLPNEQLFCKAIYVLTNTVSDHCRMIVPELAP